MEASEAQFRTFLDAAPDAIVIVDPGGAIVLVNAQTERLFGYTREELLAQPVEVLVPPRFRGAHASRRSGFFASPKVRAMGSGLELFGARKDGSEFPIEISLSPIQTAQGLLVASAIRDVTDRKQAEAALKLANRELEAFSYSVAHDLRAPLRAMNGFARLLLEGYAEELDDEGRDWLAEILDNATKMGALIDALLALSRVARAEVRPTSVNLTTEARHVCAQLAAREPGRDVRVVVADGLGAEADPVLVRSLLENLLGNAWKFTRDVAEPRIEVGVETDDRGTPAFFVRDNGAGFDMAFAGKLFAPFQRLHTTAEYAGTGIGLATVQRIVHLHGGRIWAEGQVGRGATFRFTLPRSTGGDGA